MKKPIKRRGLCLWDKVYTGSTEFLSRLDLKHKNKKNNLMMSMSYTKNDYKTSLKKFLKIVYEISFLFFLSFLQEKSPCTYKYK